MAPVSLIEVHFVSASGDVCSGPVQVPCGTSVKDLVLSKMGGSYREDRFNIRLRRGELTYGKKKLPLEQAGVLQAGDQVTVSPSKPAMA